MPNASEPFFKPDEWKALAVFRPREWREWWATEPLFSKVVVCILLALGALGLCDVATGGKGIGWFLIAAVAGLALILFVLAPLLYVVVATVRWVLRKTGLTVAAAWAAKLVLWAGVAALVLTAVGPYLSTDPVQSWYAFTQQVPVDRVTLEKEPHDCEFTTAPLGAKHCHYQAKVFTLQGADTPDGKKSLVVSYEKVDD